MKKRCSEKLRSDANNRTTVTFQSDKFRVTLNISKHFLEKIANFAFRVQCTLQNGQSLGSTDSTPFSAAVYRHCLDVIGHSNTNLSKITLIQFTRAWDSRLKLTVENS